MERCTICSRKVELSMSTQLGKVYHCKKCKHYYCKDLNDSKKYAVYNEYEYLLKKLRLRNFSRIMSRIGKYLPRGARGLEVGSALGWFLEIASDEGYDMVGIEPIKINYDRSLSDKYQVINGFFPQDMPSESGKFDFIIFNDVFEHIPNLDELVANCSKYLREDGLMIINLPLNTGIMYQIANVMAKLGLKSSYNRLWQFETESPHLNYFSEHSLTKLLRKGRFQFLCSFPLDANYRDYQSNYKRIAGIGNKKRVANRLIAALITLSVPVFDSLPKDIMCICYKKLSSENL